MTEETALVPANATLAPQETSSASAAAQAMASVQARYAMALRAPRDVDQFRAQLLKDCRRPGFAASATYAIPRGGTTITGPSIRFAEAAIRHFRNVLVSSPVVFEDEEKRITRVTVMDLEANITWEKDVTISKTVERRKPPNGHPVLSTRVNSFGQTLYIVSASDADMLAKEGAQVSKAVRTLGLRLLPGDIIEEAMDAVRRTASKSDAEDPDAARKRLVDAYASIGIQPVRLVEHLGHSLDQTTPAEIEGLRGLFQALRDGHVTWAEVMEQKRGEEKPKPKGGSLKEKIDNA